MNRPEGFRKIGRDKRQPLLADDKLGPTPTAVLSEAEAEKNDLPDPGAALGRAHRRRA